MCCICSDSFSDSCDYERMRMKEKLNLNKTFLNLKVQGGLLRHCRWLSGVRVGLMTWWLRVRSPDEATFLSGVFSPLTSAEACEKSSQWLWKEKLC